MGVSININGLTLCHKGSGGVSHNTLPDVCKTPDKGIPQAFDNEAYSRHLSKGTTSVFADGGNMIANFGSIFVKSSLDGGGSFGGLVSGTFLAEAEFITHSPSVFFEGKAACRLTDKMWMNHKNTVNMSGVLQPELSGYVGTDAIMKAACEVFCTVRQEGIDAKNAKPPKKFNYSKVAQQYANDHSGLSGVVKEKEFFHAALKGGKADIAAQKAKRALVGIDLVKKRLMKTAAVVALEKTGEKIAKTAGARLIAKFIPGVNLLSTAWDIYEAGTAVYEALQWVDQRLAAYDPAKFNTYRARPDMAVLDPKTGKPTKVYDFKFDRPAMTDGAGGRLPKYEDDWQPGQKELYDDMVGSEENVQKVDNERCKCQSKTAAAK